MENCKMKWSIVYFSEDEMKRIKLEDSKMNANYILCLGKRSGKNTKAKKYLMELLIKADINPLPEFTMPVEFLTKLIDNN